MSANDVIVSLDLARAARRESGNPAAIADDQVALGFIDLHGDDCRFVAPWGRWFLWDGQCWRPDETLALFDRVRTHCRAVAASPGIAPREAAELGRAVKMAAVERLCRADRRCAATVEIWDAGALLLGTPAGTVDLASGELRPARRGDWITKSTKVAPDFEADCPIWRTFLDRVTDGDRDLQDYLRRLAGYCLSGSIREHILAFFYGTGANGKGTFLNTLTAIWGDYARVSPASLLEARAGDQHPTEFAALAGARLVVTQETELGRRLAENRIKSLTGGDPITARRMREDFWSFEPQFTLLVASNNRPVLRAVDEALRRRLHLIPFRVHIPAEDRDPELPSRLVAEHPAILAWAIAGCCDWLESGLRPPPCVTDGTAAFLDAADPFRLWLADAVAPAGPAAWAPSKLLFASWREWASAANEFIGSSRVFADRMQAAGFEPKRQPGTGARGYAGLALRSLVDPPGDAGGE